MKKNIKAFLGFGAGSLLILAVFQNCGQGFDSNFGQPQETSSTSSNVREEPNPFLDGQPIYASSRSACPEGQSFILKAGQCKASSVADPRYNNYATSMNLPKASQKPGEIETQSVKQVPVGLYRQEVSGDGWKGALLDETGEVLGLEVCESGRFKLGVYRNSSLQAHRDFFDQKCGSESVANSSYSEKVEGSGWRGVALDLDKKKIQLDHCETAAVEPGVYINSSFQAHKAFYDKKCGVQASGTYRKYVVGKQWNGYMLDAEGAVIELKVCESNFMKPGVYRNSGFTAHEEYFNRVCFRSESGETNPTEPRDGASGNGWEGTFIGASGARLELKRCDSGALAPGTYTNKNKASHVAYLEKNCPKEGSTPPPSQGSNQKPIGAISTYLDSGNKIFGWAYDPDTPEGNIIVDIYFVGISDPVRLKAGVSRADVRSDLISMGHKPTTDNFGFEYVIPKDRVAYKMKVYALDTSGQEGFNPLIGEYSPRRTIGWVDPKNLDNGTNVHGWAYDPDTPSTSLQVHLYFGDSNEGAIRGQANMVWAEAERHLREDLGHKDARGNFRFSVPIPAEHQGKKVRVYAIDSQGTEGFNSPIGTYHPPGQEPVDPPPPANSGSGEHTICDTVSSCAEKGRPWYVPGGQRFLQLLSNEDAAMKGADICTRHGFDDWVAVYPTEHRTAKGIVSAAVKIICANN